MYMRALDILRISRARIESTCDGFRVHGVSRIQRKIAEIAVVACARVLYVYMFVLGNL